jgi:hypothetical protein
VERLRRVLVWVAALYWTCCLMVHVVVAVTLPGPLPGYSYAYWFILTMVVAVVVLNVLAPAGRGEDDPGPHWYVPALGVTALICGLWPMVVGSGVPNAPSGLRWAFEDTGVPSGPPGDRYLNSHGRRVRALTEEEFQRVEAWSAVIQSGLLAGFSGMTFAGALYFQHLRRAQNPAPAATEVFGTS